MLCHQKEHISLTHYLSEFKYGIDFLTGAGIKSRQHPSAVNMVVTGQGFKVDSLVAEEFKEKKEEVKKEAAQRCLAALFFYRLSNSKFNALKTFISNQALQGKYAVPRTYDKVLKLARGWKNKSTSTHNNNSDAGVAMVQSGGPGRGDQDIRGRRRG